MAIQVSYHHTYDARFPEDWTWAAVNQVTIETAALAICKEIQADLRTQRRLDTPGLRKALNIMAESATIGG